MLAAVVLPSATTINHLNQHKESAEMMMRDSRSAISKSDHGGGGEARRRRRTSTRLSPPRRALNSTAEARLSQSMTTTTSLSEAASMPGPFRSSCTAASSSRLPGSGAPPTQPMEQLQPPQPLSPAYKRRDTWDARRAFRGGRLLREAAAAAAVVAEPSEELLCDDSPKQQPVVPSSSLPQKTPLRRSTSLEYPTGPTITAAAAQPPSMLQKTRPRRSLSCHQAPGRPEAATSANKGNDSLDRMLIKYMSWRAKDPVKILKLAPSQPTWDQRPTPKRRFGMAPPKEEGSGGADGFFKQDDEVATSFRKTRKGNAAASKQRSSSSSSGGAQKKRGPSRSKSSPLNVKRSSGAPMMMACR